IQRDSDFPHPHGSQHVLSVSGTVLLTCRLAYHAHGVGQWGWAGKLLPQTTGLKAALIWLLCLSPGPGISNDVIEKARDFKIVTEVQQDGQDFTWSQHYSGGHTMTNKFTIGKESDIQTMGGKKFKAIVQMEGGKLVVNFPNYHQTSEIVGDKLVEVSTIGSVTYERVSKRLA
uniref:Fatty acid binding protein 6 n=1 Tax=Piliocolobus tephrosceles TaxID=591936 RepID=A0A8C9GVJ4_9PRIM